MRPMSAKANDVLKDNLIVMIVSCEFFPIILKSQSAIFTAGPVGHDGVGNGVMPGGV